MTLDQLESRAGVATTLHGGTLSIDAALRLASQGSMLPVVLNNTGGVLAHGRERRLASRGQRLALAARDRGCTLPGCHQTAAQSQIHHIHDWAEAVTPTSTASPSPATGTTTKPPTKAGSPP